LLKEDFPPDEKCFTDLNIKVDLGYLGIAKDVFAKPFPFHIKILKKIH